MRFGKTLLVSVAGAAVLAACGSEDPGDGSSNSSADGAVTVSSGKGGGSDLFQAMSDAQLEAGSFKLDMSVTANVSGKDEQVMEASGAAEVADDAVNQQLTMSMGGAAAMGSNLEIQMTMLDGITYTDMFSVMGAPSDHEWVSIDPKSDDPVSQQFGRIMNDQAGMADTTQSMIENADALTVEEGKTDTIDGTEVTEYLVTVEKADFEKLGVTGTEDLPINELTYSMWLDDKYLPHRITFDMGEEAEGVAMEINLTDFGGDVKVEAPPKDKVIPVGELIDSLLKSGDITEEDLAQLQEGLSS